MRFGLTGSLLHSLFFLTEEPDMTSPNFTILYVDNPLASADFYAGLLKKQPVEACSTFAMFALESGLMLGLWSKHTVEPAAQGGPGHMELGFTLPDRAAVLACHEEWVRQGLPIIQAPVEMDFGHTFVALDPDGHRLRAFCTHQP